MNNLRKIEHEFTVEEFAEAKKKAPLVTLNTETVDVKYYPKVRISATFNITTPGVYGILGNKTNGNKFELNECIAISVDGGERIEPTYTYEFTEIGLHVINYFLTPNCNLHRLFDFGSNNTYTKPTLVSVDLSNLCKTQASDLRFFINGNTSLTDIKGLSKINTSNVTSMRQAFGYLTVTTLDIENWQTHNLQDTQVTFYQLPNLKNIDISKWDMSNVTRIPSMFYDCPSLTSIGDLSNWNVGKVGDMSYLFGKCPNLTFVGDLSNWDTSNVTATNTMFSQCSNLTFVGDLSNWNTSKVTAMNHMFYDCSSLTSVGDLSRWNTCNVTTMRSMFNSCSSLAFVGNLSNWNVSKVTTMYCMFNGCSSLTSVGDLSNWRTPNLTDINTVFAGCEKLKEINISNFNTSNVTTFFQLFTNCYELTSVGDLSNWRSSKVTNMGKIFTNTKLTEIDIRNFDYSNVTYMEAMFAGCQNLRTINLGKFNTTEAVATLKIEKNYEIFGVCPSLNDIYLSSESTTLSLVESLVVKSGIQNHVRIHHGDDVYVYTNSQWTKLSEEELLAQSEISLLSLNDELEYTEPSIKLQYNVTINDSEM